MSLHRYTKRYTETHTLQLLIDVMKNQNGHSTFALRLNDYALTITNSEYFYQVRNCIIIIVIIIIIIIIIKEFSLIAHDNQHKANGKSSVF